MSLQEELTSPLAESVAPQHSLLDEIMSRTRIQPESDGYDVARQGVVAFIRSILTSDTDVLEKQINERLDGVLSRWLLLKNQTMPETATGAKSGSNN